MSDEQPVISEKVLEGRGVLLRLNRPKALNALGGTLLDALDAELDAISSDPELRVVVITGDARCFSAGADLKEELTDRSARVQRMHDLVLRLAELPVATIAAIEGWALGGGLELAMACTFRAAAPSAKLGVPEIHMGAIPGYGGTQTAARIVGPARALELVCFGEPVDGVTAERIGLVNWVASEDGGALALALEKAGLLAKKSVAAVRAGRDAIREGAFLPLADGLAVEKRVSAQWHGAEDLPQGFADFRDGKRKPMDA